MRKVYHIFRREHVLLTEVEHPVNIRLIVLKAFKKQFGAKGVGAAQAPSGAALQSLQADCFRRFFSVSEAIIIYEPYFKLSNGIIAAKFINKQKKYGYFVFLRI